MNTTAPLAKLDISKAGALRIRSVSKLPSSCTPGVIAYVAQGNKSVFCGCNTHSIWVPLASDATVQALCAPNAEAQTCEGSLPEHVRKGDDKGVIEWDPGSEKFVAPKRKYVASDTALGTCEYTCDWGFERDAVSKTCKKQRYSACNPEYNQKMFVTLTPSTDLCSVGILSDFSYHDRPSFPGWSWKCSVASQSLSATCRAHKKLAQDGKC